MTRHGPCPRCSGFVTLKWDEVKCVNFGWIRLDRVPDPMPERRNSYEVRLADAARQLNMTTQGLFAAIQAGEVPARKNADGWVVTQTTIDRMRPLPEGHKRCGGCRQVLPVDNFYRSKQGRFGRASECAVCSRRRSRRTYHRAKAAT